MDQNRSQQLTLSSAEIYLSIEEQILENIAGALEQGLETLEEDVQAWQIEQLSMLGQLSQQNLITIAQMSGLAMDEIVAMLEEAGYSAVDENESDLQEAVEAGLAVQPPEPRSSRVLSAIVIAYTAQAKDSFNLINTTMLKQSEQIYLNIINQTVGKLVAGTLTPRQALAQTAAAWAEVGVPALVDRAGKHWSTEAYINSVLRSMVSNIAMEMQEGRMDEYELDLIEVSSHAGARPKCAPHQGKVYSRSGKTKGYPSLKNTSYGKPDGLFGINCGHRMYPFIPGVSERVYNPIKSQKDREENARIYEESQKQRKLERDIRKAKRQLKMVEHLGDEEMIANAKENVRQKQSNMRAFIENTERTRRYDREQITHGRQETVTDLPALQRKVNRTNDKAQYKEFKQVVGKETLKNLEEFQNLKYTNENDWYDLKGYKNAVEKGDINVLTGFDVYKKTANNVRTELVGQTTSDGIAITSFKSHFVDRIIGQIESGTSSKGKRAGVRIEDVKDALLNPVQIISKNGSRQYVSEKCRVSINDTTGHIIQTAPRTKG